MSLSYEGHDGQYSLENGAFTCDYNADIYYVTLAIAFTDMPTSPDFFVLSGVYGGTEATIATHGMGSSNANFHR
ncbi:hypothetical protein OB919_05265 [Halobacteria archaeon AArc-curdl1]|uniref:Uncharacterized protein n=1 Tax=Natronosalvus hydrolyticus TaxID=2979988 RepID=A0AAP3E636_9EURY|nr:hypothetical protein [Halobacteria archaeon AArc-curdl1]